jgi:hypothetical protein
MEPLPSGVVANVGKGSSFEPRRPRPGRSRSARLVMAMTTQEVRAHYERSQLTMRGNPRHPQAGRTTRLSRPHPARREASSGRLVSAEAGRSPGRARAARTLLFHDRDAEPKRRERAALRESEWASVRWSSSTAMTTPSGMRSMTSARRCRTRSQSQCSRSPARSREPDPANREIVSRFVS